MIVLALAALVLFPVQGQPAYPSALVTYETRAKLLPKVIEEVSARSGVVLRCSTQMEKEVVAMEVHARPLSELMPELAFAVTGKWELKKEGWWLVRDTAKAKEEEKEELKARADALRKSAAGFMAGLDKSFDSGRAEEAIAEIRAAQTRQETNRSQENWRAVLSSRGLRPGGRAVARCLKAIGFEALASLQVGDRVVFADKPHPSQETLGKGAKSIVDAFVQDQAAWAQAMQKKPLKSSEDYPMAVATYYDENPLPSYPAKVLFIAEVGIWPDTVSLEWIAANALGDVIYRFTTNLQARPESDLQPPKIPKTLVWSERSASLLQSMKAATHYEDFGGYFPRLTDHWRRRLSDCVKEDPLSYLASDALFAIGRNAAKNWIAVPADSTWLVLSETFSHAKQEPPEALWRHVLERRVEGANSWAAIRPFWPSIARRERRDRALLAPLLRTVLETGDVRLDPYAEYVAAAGPELLSQLDHELLYLIRLSTPGNIADFGKWRALQLYGSLARGQRAALLQGEQLAMSQLIAGQRTLAANFVFGADPPVEPIKERVATPGGTPAMRHIFRMATLRLEPTEVFPLGVLPPSTVLAFEGGRSDVLYGYRDARDSSYRSGKPFDVGFAEPQLALQGRKSVELFRLGEKTSLAILLRSSPLFAIKSTLNQESVDFASKLKTLAELPEAIRADYQRGIESAKKMIERGEFPLPGGTTKPPPR